MKKILLLCQHGMSTSLFVKKMIEAAKKREIDVEIKAVGLEKFEENIDKYDVFLLGPQVKYRKAEFINKVEAAGKKLDVIESVDYGMMKVDKVLDFALNLI